MQEVENLLKINKTSEQKLMMPFEEFASKKIISLESDEEGYNQCFINGTTSNDDFCNLKQISYSHTTTLSPRANEHHKPITATINLIDDFMPIQED